MSSRINPRIEKKFSAEAKKLLMALDSKSAGSDFKLKMDYQLEYPLWKRIEANHFVGPFARESNTYPILHFELLTRNNWRNLPRRRSQIIRHCRRLVRAGVTWN